MAAFARHGVLVASQVTTVELKGATGSVEVMNRSGTAEIYFVVGRSNPADPTVGGDDTYVVPAGLTSYVVDGLVGDVFIKLISSGTPAYSVIGPEE